MNPVLFTNTAADFDDGTILCVRAYFIFSVLVGGILGLSLANAVFVDEMTIDNTRDLEQLVESLRDEIREYRKELEQKLGSSDSGDAGDSV